MRPVILLLFLLTATAGLGQTAEPLRIDSLPPQGILLDKGWKWHAGDNPDWAKVDLDDSGWESIEPAMDIMDVRQLWQADIGWLRLKFSTSSLVANKALAMLVQQTGASEIYLNGQFIGQFGEIRDKAQQVQAATPVNGSFIGLPLRKPGEQVLAVRFAIQKNIQYVKFAGRPNVSLALRVMEIQSIASFTKGNITQYFEYLRAGLLLILCVIHFALFWFYSSKKSNLYFLLYALFNAISTILIALVYTHIDLATNKMLFFIVTTSTFIISYLFFLSAVYKTFNQRIGIIYWVLVAYSLVSVFLLFSNYHSGFDLGINTFLVLIFLECIRITILAIKKNQLGATIVVWGIAGYLIFYALFYLFVYGYLPAGPGWIYGSLVFNLSFVSIPVAISIYLALESSFASRGLTEKLKEVQQLSSEKQQILATQNETLEKQVEQRTAQLNHSLEDLKATQAQLIQKEKMASLGELTAGIAHEIQNPLNFVNNFSEVSTELVEELKEEIKADRTNDALAIAEDLTQNLQKISQHGTRASSIVKGMLEHSRTSTGQRQPTDINALASEYLRLSYQGLRAKNKSFNATLETDFAVDLTKIDVVPQEIGRVLLNLFNNAFHAVHQKQRTAPAEYQPTVWLSTRQLEGKVEIRVKDNGMGIPEGAKAKIFQPFFTTKPTGEGTGLGLSLSYEIVTKGHGGTLTVESVEGEGTTFVVTL